MLFMFILWLPCLLAKSTTGHPQKPAQLYSVTNETRFAGVNICGFDFGCDSEGSCDLSGIDPPLIAIPPTHSTSLGHDGPAQMGHFAHADNLNMFRLPVSWQYLTNNTLGGQLNPTNFGYYDRVVQGCLATGAHCQVDLHNYARWEGTVIGEPGGPSNAQFADIWAQIARRYAKEYRIWFGVMNEPHGMASAAGWAGAVQAAVTAIRQAGAATQFISLPGTGWQSAGALAYDGSGEALARVTNPDRSTTGLVFDVHLYLDVDGTGQAADCVTDGISESWAPLAAWLRKKGRQAIVTETGGGRTSSCIEYVCKELHYLKSSSDVFLGYLMWAAGSFKDSYVLSLTPVSGNDTWVDTELITKCVVHQ